MRPSWLYALVILLVAPRCQNPPSTSSSDPPDTPPQEPPATPSPPGTPGGPSAPPPVPPPDPGPRVISVSTQAQLVSALRGVRPGDEIHMADGIYVGGVVIDRSGEPGNPITLRGNRHAIVNGGNMGRAAIALRANDWVIRGVTVTNALWGVYVTGGNRNLLDSVEVSQVGQEGVHFANFSSDNIIQNSYIHDTGLAIAEFGEGVYLGSAYRNWDDITGGLADQSDRNQVLNNVIGPNVRSEHVDAKEGTTGGIIRGNRLDGTGMVQSQFWVDSWMEIKGNDYQIIENQGTNAITDGFQVVSVRGGWGNGNILRRNVADVHASGFGIRIASGFENLVGCDNVVTAAGSGFASVDCIDLPGSDSAAILRRR